MELFNERVLQQESVLLRIDYGEFDMLNTLNQFGVQYVNGVGLVYQREFDTFGELIRNLLRPRGKKQPVKPSPINTPTLNQPATTVKSDEDDQ